jgi:ABC-type glycerol-3-phosphate transport system substrate-binding protein
MSPLLKRASDSWKCYAKGSPPEMASSTTFDNISALTREYASMGDYGQRLATQAAAGNLPDVPAIWIDVLQQYGTRGALAPLNPYVELGVIDTSEWDPLVRDHGMLDNSIYMLSSGVTVNCLIVNHDIIKRGGLEPPPFEISWDDWATYVGSLQPALPANTWCSNDPGAIGETISGWIQQRGYPLANEDWTNAGFPREVLVQLLEFAKERYDSGVILPIEISSIPLSDYWVDAPLSRGQIAMMFINTNQLKTFQMYIDDELWITRTPLMTDGVNPAGDYLRGSGLAIAANSKLADEAAKFIDFFLNDVDAQRIFDMELGAIGPKHVQDALRDDLDPKDVTVLEHFNHILQDIPHREPNPPGGGSAVGAIQRANESVRYGTSIEDAVDTAMAEIEEAFSVNL